MKRFKPDCPVCRQTFVNMTIGEDSASNVVEHNVEREGESDDDIDANDDDGDAIEEASEPNEEEGD